mmetsp:Transcript_23785/g.77333  ORF Transcript_23785/g.77333 Transcript_23785/m.77333 type:complete len:307 (-) Transcript_23785:936-1856(-)
MGSLVPDGLHQLLHRVVRRRSGARALLRCGEDAHELALVERRLVLHLPSLGVLELRQAVLVYVVGMHALLDWLPVRGATFHELVEQLIHPALPPVLPLGPIQLADDLTALVENSRRFLIDVFLFVTESVAHDTQQEIEHDEHNEHGDENVHEDHGHLIDWSADVIRMEQVSVRVSRTSDNEIEVGGDEQIQSGEGLEEAAKHNVRNHRDANKADQKDNKEVHEHWHACSKRSRDDAQVRLERTVFEESEQHEADAHALRHEVHTVKGALAVNRSDHVEQAIKPCRVVLQRPSHEACRREKLLGTIV